MLKATRSSHLVQLVAALFASISFASSEDEQMLAGLRDRRLFSLAESYCRERLNDNQLSDYHRAQLTIELIRGRAAHALNSTPEQRTAIWKRAHDAADEFLSRQSDSPRAILVQVQNAMTYLAHGQLLRQELEAGAVGAGARDMALAELRQAAKLFETLDKRLTKEIPIRRRSPDDKGLSANELTNLQNNIRHQLAKTFRNQALCYEPKSIDRIDALTRVVERHDELLRRLPDDDELRWEIRLEAVICQRLLGNFDNARQMIVVLARQPLPTMIALRARAEAARLELDTGNPKAALQVLAKGREANGMKSPDLDFAHLETFEAMRKASGENQEEAVLWQKRSVEVAKLIEQTHGPYWARRANLLLVRSVGTGGGMNDLNVLVRVADNFFNKEQYEEAIAAYDKAARQAQMAKNVVQSFALFYKAALVEHGRKQHAKASNRFRELGLVMSSHPKASAAHLLAVWNVSQLASRDSRAVSHYIELLDEHIATWPEQPTADQARVWLARLREHERSWTEAIDLYLEVSPASDQFAAAVEAASRCSQKHFAELRSSGQEFEEQAKLSAARFEDLIYDAGRNLPETWSAPQRNAALAAARMRLQFIAGDHANASAVLEAALKGSDGADERWKTSVRSLLVVALAGQPSRRREATSILNSVAGTQPGQLLEMLDGLSTIADAARPLAKAEIAKLQLSAIETAGSVKLDDAGQLRLSRIKAEALAASGQFEAANVLYKRLATAQPRNGRIQEGYAQLLLKSDEKSILRQSIVQWRKVGQASRPKSERWYRSRYSICLAHYKLGEKKRAAELIKYLKITPPGLDSSPLRDEFDSLLRRCQAN